jgi:hypothetical protein
MINLNDEYFFKLPLDTSMIYFPVFLYLIQATNAEIAENNENGKWL